MIRMIRMITICSLLWCVVNLVNGEVSCEAPGTLDQTNLLQRGVHQVAVPANVGKYMVNMGPVQHCLQLTTPNITLKYPTDAEEHFEELRNVLSPWFGLAAQRFMKEMQTPYHCWSHYCGPWIENYWIETFLSAWQNRSSEKDSQKRLAEMFGPFIPVFMPFNDLANASDEGPGHDGNKYEDMLETLAKHLRPDVAYVTVVMHAGGLVANRGRMNQIMKKIPNLLVFSAGGYGHVPIPLLKQPEDLLGEAFFKPMEKREFLVSYMGRPDHTPYQMRMKMIETMKKEAQTLGVKVYSGFGSGDDWKQVAGNSRFSLCPRGFGRTAYHLTEILQLGLIPIHVYLDIPWIPYPGVYKKIGFSTDLDGLPKLMKELKDMPLQELERMEKQIRSVRASHFSYKGTMNQISRFMKNEASALQCQKVPTSPLGR